MNSLKTHRYYPVHADSLGEARPPRNLIAPEESTRSRGHFEILVQEFAIPPCILIAEDDEDSRIMMRALLEFKGYRVIEANDGPKTIEVALEEQPLLLLLDLELPRLNGLEVARHLRRRQGTQDLAIVILSGHDPAKYRITALAAGCDSYLSKPIDFDRLDEILSCYAPIGKN